MFIETQKNLESPNFPLEYRKNNVCIWKLKAPKGYQVALKFQSFHIENHEKCFYDYIEIRDGSEIDSPLLGLYCGSNIPPDIKSTHNEMLVKFHSDNSIEHSGFSVIIFKEYNECSDNKHGCEHDCINTIGSYKCECKIGYELQSDGRSCKGLYLK